MCGQVVGLWPGMGCAVELCYKHVCPLRCGAWARRHVQGAVCTQVGLSVLYWASCVVGQEGGRDHVLGQRRCADAGSAYRIAALQSG